MTTGEEKASKSERKRQHDYLQKLGESLIRLNRSDLDELPIAEAVRDAVLAVRSIRQHGAMRRQRQYIGKLMRDVDPQALQAALNALYQPSLEATRIHHAAEQWRDRLIQQGNDALTVLLEGHPSADRQLFHSLLRAIKKGPQGNPRPARELYRALRGLFENR